MHELKNQLIGIPEVVFMGSRDEVQSYMQNADYVAQLSDNEGFCYAIHEALQVGVPCLVSRWDGVEKVIEHGQNGLILDMDLSNFDINELYNFRPQKISMPDNAAQQMWERLFLILNKNEETKS